MKFRSMSRPASIIATDLVKRYPGAKNNAVDGVNLEVSAGEMYGFLGPNGAGKSTSVQLFCSTLQPSSGQALVAGYDTVREAKIVRQKIGVVFQNASLDRNLTVEENLRFHAHLYGLTNTSLTYRSTSPAYRKRLTELLEVFELNDRSNELIKNLSGGLKRRVDIAKALLHLPEVLFLDEPTTGLDPFSRRAVWQYLAQLHKERGFTVFLTTQYLEEAEICSRISIIDKGKIQITDTPKQLKRSLGEEYLVLSSPHPQALEQELRQKKIAFEQLSHGEFSLGLKDKGAQQLLRSLETELDRFTMKEPTLDDVFLKVTGHTLEDHHE